MGGGMVSASDLPQLRSSNISEEDIHHLRNENLSLKKQINSQEDKTKKYSIFGVWCGLVIYTWGSNLGVYQAVDKGD